MYIYIFPWKGHGMRVEKGEEEREEKKGGAVGAKRSLKHFGSPTAPALKDFL